MAGFANNAIDELQEAVYETFTTFCSFGAGQRGESLMDSAHLMKLCKDANILDTHLTRTNVDLIFTKVKGKGTTKLTYDQFNQALHMFADKKRVNPTALMLQIAGVRGPTVSGTVADANRFHDDKSTYTGVYAKGGPTKIDHLNDIRLENLMDRTETDIRGVKSDTSRVHKPVRRTLVPGAIGVSAGMAGLAVSDGREDREDVSKTPFGAMLSGSSASEAVRFTDSELEDNLYDVFCSFCVKASEPSLASSGFAKFCKDMKLIGGSLTLTDVDLIFQKTKSGGNYAKTISYTEFRQVAIPLLAQRRKATEQQILQRCSKIGGKVLVGTVASFNRFHDDKSTYTGVYKKGGPTHVDNVITQEMLANRDVKATVRGVPDRPQGYFTHADASAGSMGNVPRTPQEVIGETPMYNRGQGELPPTPQGERGGGGGGGGGGGQSQASFKRQSGIVGATVAGEANRPGGVYDRLSSKKTFTGVYKKRFEGGGGRINGDTVNGRSYNGDTNGNTDERVIDISQVLRR
ncbi:hypothetical protein TrCOL_g12442 [Triparma columacea]|uniref:P25-alpha family protein n=1 Tax=Triparma columacea TaxID=722753 RepID=A0A9W7GD86_9STRA|nr:hypothetical protein TrCOL_g12442 [Triparma columacea]